MDAGDQNCLHRDAVKYYYELAAPHEADVPDSVVRHVCGCPACRARIRSLRETVGKTTGEALLHQGRMDRDVIEILNLHFRWLGEPVTCCRAKPFLPGLLIPARRIRIPTPITVHVDHCPQCTEDLKALRDLALEPEQLQRLGQLYAAKPAGKSLICRPARLKIPAFAAAALAGIDGRLLNHLCACRHCRAQVGQHRQNLLDREPSRGTEPGAGCRDSVSVADLFDYAVAYNLPAEMTCEAGSTKRPAGTHVRTCPHCLEKIQTLHRTLYGIAERPDSGVVTTYQTAGPGPKAPVTDDLYPGYPINVRVARRPSEAALAPSRWPAAAVARRRPASRPRVRLLLKTAIVAAAVVPLAILFLSTPSASGITLGEVIKAFAKADNIHVSTFNLEADSLEQELWLSRERKTLIASVPVSDRRTLYSLDKGEKRETDRGTAISGSVGLSPEEHENALKLMEDCVGLSDVPRRAQWSRVDGETDSGVELYELTWTVETNEGASISMKRTVSVDLSTRLPQEVRQFRKLSVDDEWEERLRTEFEYLTDEEMTAALQSQTP